jgi:hypothetical protein
MEEDQPKLAKGRKVAILVAAGVAIDEVEAMQNALKAQNMMSEIVGRMSARSRGMGASPKP